MIFILVTLLTAAQPIGGAEVEVDTQDVYEFYGPIWESPYVVPLAYEHAFEVQAEPTVQVATLIEEHPCTGFEDEEVDVRIEHVEQEAAEMLVLLRALKLRVEEEEAQGGLPVLASPQED